MQFCRVMLRGEMLRWEPLPESSVKQAVRVQCTVVDHLADTPERERYVDALVKARAKKGLKPEAARELLEDGNYYGTMMTLCVTAHGHKKCLGRDHEHADECIDFLLSDEGDVSMLLS